MKTRLISIGDLTAADEQEWNALAQRAVEPNPFFEPGFLVLASRHFEGFAKSRLLIAEDGAEMRGVLPIIGIDRPRLPPRPTMRTHGNPTMVSGLSTPLVDRSAVTQTVGVLLEGLETRAKHGDLPGILSLTRITEYGQVIEAFRREAGARGMPTFTKETWERGMVSRGTKWEHPLTGDRRRSNARRRRALAKDFGVDVRIVNRTHDPSAMVDFVRMEASGWKGTGDGTAYARDPAKVAWFQEWCAWWASAGRVIVIAVNLGEKSIAMLYCVLAGEGIFLYRTAYDDAYSKYGPGALLLEAVMEVLLGETSAEWVDSSTDPVNKINLEMLPERQTMAMLLVGTGGRVDRSVISAMPAMTRGVAEIGRIRRRLRQAAAKARNRSGEGGEGAAV